jgi:hypothetical protein
LLASGFNPVSRCCLWNQGYNIQVKQASLCTASHNGTGAVLEGSSVKLKSSDSDPTMFGDSSEDDLKGDEGLDWYFADLDDKLHGKINDELLDLLID